MRTLAYLIAIVVTWGILSRGMERAVRRTFTSRTPGMRPRLIEELDLRPRANFRRSRRARLEDSRRTHPPH